jgi:hypothetical protein
MRMTLAQDPKVQKDAFSTMPEDQFVDIVFLSIIYSHLESWNDEEGLTALINKTLY